LGHICPPWNFGEKNEGLLFSIFKSGATKISKQQGSFGILPIIKLYKK
jgi:hypothetical protein